MVWRMAERWFGRRRRREGPRRRFEDRPEIPPESQTWRRFAAPAGVTAEQLLATATNDLERLYYGPRDRIVTKWHHYLRIYDRHLAGFRGTPVRFLEIGVYRGGSLQLWREYLGEAAQIHGIDISPNCARLDEPGVSVHIGSQADPAFLEGVARQMGGIDVVIDDGSHVPEHQVASFRVLFPRLADGGVYIVEDLHTNYWRAYGGGVGAPESFIAFAKAQIDGLHAPYLEGADAGRVDRVADLDSIALYDSVAVLQKRVWT
nr:class I SAM-dependent methyltransferase [Bauldia sp.]